MTVPVRRVTVTSDRPFDDVVAALYAGLGRVPDIGALERQWNAAADRDEFDAVVGPVAGSSGLIEFLTLDLGAALTIRDPDHGNAQITGLMHIGARVGSPAQEREVRRNPDFGIGNFGIRDLHANSPCTNQFG